MIRAGRGVALALITLLLLVVGACSSSDEAEVLRIGVLPDKEDQRLREQYEPLVRYLDTTAGVTAELYLPDTYDDLVQRFAAGEIDLAWFGGLTFILAQEGGAAPLVMRDVDLEFTSDILVAASATGEAIDDYRGSTFAFGPELSTSGHLMPRYFLLTTSGAAEDLFGEIRHSEGHDSTVRWVRDGVVEIGAANSQVVEAMFEDGSVTTDDVRVLTRTPPFHNYVWATSPAVDDALRDRLLGAFLALDPTEPDDAAMLDRLGAGGYVPATAEDFVAIRSAAEALGLVEEDG